MSRAGGAADQKLLSEDRDPRNLAEVDYAKRDEALERYEAIRPYLEGREPIQSAVERSGKSLRTVREWVAAYRSKDLLGLVPGTRSDLGNPRVDRRVREYVEALVLSPPRQTASLIWGEALREAERHGWRPPSYRQVLAIEKKVTDSEKCLAHEGTKAHKQGFDLLVRFEAKSSNYRWQVDHKHLDIWLRDGKGGRAKKPWLTIVQDDYSRAVVGMYLDFGEPSAQRVALALRQAMLPKPGTSWPMCGIPEVIYSDNGPDFRSDRVRQMATHLGVQLVFSTPAQPRGRGKIERLFRSVDDMFLKGLPGFRPGGKAPKADKLLSRDRCDRLLKAWICDKYHERVHTGTKLKPRERWEADGFLPALPESWDQLDLLLMTVPKTRRVQREGISFRGHYYSDLALSSFVKEDVVIRYDPSDMGEIRVYHRGRFICRAVCFELAGGSFTEKDVRRANSDNRKRLRASLKDRKANMEVLLAARRGDPADPLGPDQQPGSPKPESEDPEYLSLKGYDDE